ncbi:MULTISPECIES: L,D-transpeptidase family protein [unclassified Frankia]|uniref:L,D-transpeptidase family protein n=1 Tax=unclassified Frankia TaxID=2632575 RepID=UPI001EF6C9F6|nr:MULTISPECIES: L,D-transpeptidase family protein [unclassified Frankia]
MMYVTIFDLGAEMSERIADVNRQVIVVSAPDQTATTNTVTLWQRTDACAGWTRAAAPLAGRNGANGWSLNHYDGDLCSPVGVFTLTAAGGRQPDPGTLMPYEYRPSYYQTGEPDMAAAFDYVVAIDYNRMPGYPPSDPKRPLGTAAGGGIWLHVDHNCATQGCVAVTREGIVAILAWLSPASRPLIVMGDAASLGK